MVGPLELDKRHLLARGTQSFAISEKLRGLCCLVGQAEVYDQASELLEKVGGVSVSAMQIQRLCCHYGGQLDPLIEADCSAVIPRLEPRDAQDPLYVMVDGAMLFTRPDEWREIKLGRLFHGSQTVQLSGKRRQTLRSVYVSHLGSVDKFFPKLERHLTHYRNRVIIGDGAGWIWRWAEDNYPGATHILDFYHAREKLVVFAAHQFSEDEQRQNWINQQCDRLLDNKLEQVLSTLKACRAKDAKAAEAKAKLIAYYIEHDDRMQYKTYREAGLLIGSGPIEAAHRSVIQQRMKLSGQKWSIDGAQAIANLRCYHRSKAWDMVEKVVQAA